MLRRGYDHPTVTPKTPTPLGKNGPVSGQPRNGPPWGSKSKKWPEIYPVQSERRPWPSTMQRRRLRSLLVAMTGCANWNATVRCLRPFKYSSMEMASTVGTSYPSPGLPNHIRRSSCPKHNTKWYLRRLKGSVITRRKDCGCCSGVTLLLPSRSYTSIWNKERSGTPSGFPPIR